MPVFAKHIVDAIGLFEFFELLILAPLLLTATLYPSFLSSMTARLEHGLDRLSKSPIRAVGGVIALAIIARGALIPLLGMPSPILADETSLFLQAQTYLSGHLSVHRTLTPDYESVFVNLSPTYSSIYPVLRSAPMALGQAIGLNFWFGVWGSVILLCAATYWMVVQWTNRRYALLGAILVLLHFGLFSFWVNSYWGGAFTALGGTLLLGGYKSLITRPNIYAGAILGLGVLILITTRPFEGLCFSAPLAIGLVVKLINTRPGARRTLFAAGVVSATFVVAGILLTTVHDRATTGDWKLSPYTLYRQTVAETPPFLFENPKPHAPGRYNLTRLALNHERVAFDRGIDKDNWIGDELARLRNAWNFYIGVALSIPFVVGVGAVLIDPFLTMALVVLFLGLSVETWDFAHYAAPAFGVFILAIVSGLRALRRWTPNGRPVGLALSRLLPLGLAAGLILPMGAAFAGLGSFENESFSSACCALRTVSMHDLVSRLVDASGERNIVIVDTGPAAPLSQMYVYNDALIENSRTIWINNDPALNALTLTRYPARRRWRLDWTPDGGACLKSLDAVDGHPAGATGSTGRIGATIARDGWIANPAPPCGGGYFHAATR